ncbi:MAG: hypothetical protein ACLUAR_12045 [Pilosibacter sp.]
MRKKSKRILAAALSAILIWNTCEWQPQALAAGSLQWIGAETEADDTAETAEKEAALKKSALKASPSDASPSNAAAKDNRGESGTNKAEAGTDADTGKAEAGADADTGKAEAGANGAIAGTEAGINGAPNGTATGAKIEAFLGLDEAIAVQKLSLGAKESDIVLPDTLEVRMKQETSEDTPKAEGELQIAAEADTEKESLETDADEDISRISGVTWKLDIGEATTRNFTAGSPHRNILKNLTKMENLSKPPIRLGMAIMRQIRTTTAVPMSTHRFCRRNIHWERRQSFRKSAFS